MESLENPSPASQSGSVSCEHPNNWMALIFRLLDDFLPLTSARRLCHILVTVVCSQWTSYRYLYTVILYETSNDKVTADFPDPIRQHISVLLGFRPGLLCLEPPCLFSCLSLMILWGSERQLHLKLRPSMLSDTTLIHLTLKGPERQTENAQEEITALQHCRCQSKALALHVIKPTASMP